MADDLGVKVYGLPEFAARLRALRNTDIRKVARSGAAAAATIFRRSVAANAPVLKKIDTRRKNPRVMGALKRAVIAARSSRKSGPGKEVYVVSFRVRGGKNSAFYWRWVEGGHIVRGPGQRLKGGNRTRALQRARIKASGGSYVPGRWFVRQAFQGNQVQAADAVSKRLNERILQVEKELNGR
jgi:hypothetical protein